MYIQERFPFHEVHLDDAIWLLCLNFYQECSDSFLDDEVIIDEEIIWNSSYSKLCYDINNVKLEVIIDSDTTYISVYEGKRFWNRYNYDQVYSSVYRDKCPEIECYIRGNWEETIFKEYEKRKFED